MREIKFKAKRVDNGEWAHGSLVQTKHGTFILDIIFIPAKSLPSEKFQEVDPETICEYTGLKDKDGKEVFEGDELRPEKKDKYEGDSFNTFEVFWHDNDCTPTDCGLVVGRLKTHGSSGGGYNGYKLIPRDVGRMSIVGNIHD